MIKRFNRLSYSEAGKELGVSQPTIRRWVIELGLVPVDTGWAKYISPADFAKLKRRLSQSEKIQRRRASMAASAS